MLLLTTIHLCPNILGNLARRRQVKFCEVCALELIPLNRCREFDSPQAHQLFLHNRKGLQLILLFSRLAQMVTAVDLQYFAVKFMSDDPLQIGWSSDFETVGGKRISQQLSAQEM
jgi:hypothetical protein